MKYVIDTDKLPCNNGKNCTTCPFWSIDDTCEITEQVKKLPKYEERPHGEWMWKEYDPDYDCGDIVCSKCSVVIYEGVSQSRLKVVKWPFCPDCGADMREGDEK